MQLKAEIRGTPGWSVVLLRLLYLALTSVFTLMRLLPMSEMDNNVEILALRHQIAVLQRQIRQTPPHPARPCGIPKCRHCGGPALIWRRAVTSGIIVIYGVAAAAPRTLPRLRPAGAAHADQRGLGRHADQQLSARH
jgi:hypothetical protein